MKRPPIVVLAAFAAFCLATVPAWAADDAVIGEVLEILLERGDIDRAKYTELAARNERYQAKQQGLLSRIEFSGDFRGRMENFWFDEDAFGGEDPDRNRGRYRLRLQGKARVNDHVTAVFRLASGEGGARSTNRTLGKDDEFGPDDLFIDRAYIELRPWLEQDFKVVLGRQSNPFRWKKGKDYMMFDGDINPEGVAVRWGHDVTDDVSVFANAGYMILDENGARKDPHMFALQGGVHARVTENITLGGRATWYSFSSLDSGFLSRGMLNGNIGLTQTEDDGIDAFEIAGYVECGCSETWPMLFYFHYAQNTDAWDGISGREDDTGWGVGLEIGDKKKVAKLGVGYYELEADFFPSQFQDSDLMDGATNREGFTLYGSKTLWKNTDLNLTLFVSEEIEDDAFYASSLSGSDRVRLQTDLVIKF